MPRVLGGSASIVTPPRRQFSKQQHLQTKHEMGIGIGIGWTKIHSIGIGIGKYLYFLGYRNR